VLRNLGGKITAQAKEIIEPHRIVGTKPQKIQALLLDIAAEDPSLNVPKLGQIRNFKARGNRASSLTIEVSLQHCEM
jgi:hypothetical protein